MLFWQETTAEMAGIRCSTGLQGVDHTQVQIIHFSFEGTDYILDLTEDTARGFYDALEPFLQVARKDTKDVLKKVKPRRHL